MKICQFRFADRAGTTVVYPVELLPSPSSSGRPREFKFAIVGTKPARVIYPVTGIEDLDPKVIEANKDKILSILKDSAKPQSNSLLNGIVRALGLARNWTDYRQTFADKLLPFLKDQELTCPRRLLEREPDGVVHLTYRQVADRLFASGRKLPLRLFTGIGFNYWVLLELALAQPDLHVEALMDGPVTGPLDTSRPPGDYSIHGEGVEFSFMDAFGYSCNLLGDQLCDDGSSPQTLIPQAEPGEGQRLQDGLKIFQRLIRLTERGWVNVIPYNDKVAFLTDGVGGYDIVFKGLRDELLSVSPTDKGDTVPEEDVDQAFLAWSYFDYDGWRDQDQHAAEQKFYAAGGTFATSPGSTALLRDFLTSNGKYAPNVVRTAAAVDLTGLVTIGAFKKYPRDVGKIGKAIGNDPWLYANGNREESDDLPVSATWEEAVDYVRWINSKGRHQYRLPTEDEYRATFAQLIPEHISIEDVKHALFERLIEFISPDGAVYKGHPPYMHPDDFARLTVRYRHPVPMKGGVVRSAYFGEWLEPEGAAINGLFFCAQYAVASAHKVIVSPSRARFPKDSTGKYKSMKIGFRLALTE